MRARERVMIWEHKLSELRVLLVLPLPRLDRANANAVPLPPTHRGRPPILAGWLVANGHPKGPGPGLSDACFRNTTKRGCATSRVFHPAAIEHGDCQCSPRGSSAPSVG